MLSLNEVRESIVFYGEENSQAVDFITVLIGKTLPASTHASLSNLTLNEVSNLTKEDLLVMDGIGNVAAERIVAAIGLGKSLNANRFKERVVINSSEKAIKVFDHLKGLDQEHVDVAYLDTKNQIISIKNIFKGSLNSSVAHPREIFKHAVKLSAARILIAHNHPSGNPEPSDADIQFTERLKESGKMLGIDLLDHIIVGNQSVSLAEDGYL